MSDWDRTSAELKCMLNDFETSGITVERCQQYLKKIDSGFRQQKKEVLEYICGLYGKIRSRKTLPTIQNLMSGKVPAKCDDLLYFLRVYALFGACMDVSIEIAVGDLEKFSDNSKLVGKYAVIDFLLTRKEISRGKYTLLLHLRQSLSESDYESKRYSLLDKFINHCIRTKELCLSESDLALLRHEQLKDTERILSHFFDKPIQTSSRSLNCNSNIGSLSKSKNAQPKCGLSESLARELKILDHLDTLTLREKLFQMMLKHETFNREERQEVIRKLKLLIRTNSENAVIVTILSLCVQLEDPFSAHNAVIGHVWRLVRVMKHFPNEDFKAVYIGLKACFFSQVEEPYQQLLHENMMTKYEKLAASFIYAADCWNKIADLADEFKFDTASSFLCRCIIQIISLGFSKMTTNISSDAKVAFDRLMIRGNVDKIDLDKTVELEWAYCTVMNRPFDSENLKGLISRASTTIKTKIWILLAKGSVNEPVEAYLWCSELARQGIHSPEILELFKELLFLDLDSRLTQEEYVFPDRCATVADIYPMWNDLKKGIVNTVRLMDFLLFAWQTLRNSGCHNDALGILFQVWRLSNSTWGSKSLRTILCQVMLKRYTEYLKLDISTYHKISQVDLEVPKCLEAAFSLSQKIIDPPIFSNCTFKQFEIQLNEFLQNHNFTQSNITLTMPLLWYGNYDSLEERDKMSEAITSIFEAAREIKNLSWDERLIFTRRLRHLQLIAVRYGIKLDEDYGQCFHQILGSPMCQSRAHYSEKLCDIENAQLTLPSDIVCVCLDFDDDQYIVIRRYEPGFADPLTVRLCINSEHYPEDKPASADWRFSTVLAHIDSIIEKSLNPAKSYSANSRGAEEFWKDQLELDHDLYRYLRALEPAWFGGFVGLLSPNSILESHGLETSLSKCLSKNSPVSVTPAFANLLHFAKRHPKAHRNTVSSFLKSEFPNIDSATIQEAEAILSHAPEFPQPTIKRGVVLVCDKASANIPWESLAILRRQEVTRALSLQHLQELIEFRKTHEPPPQRQVTYLVNPDKNLPPTHIKTLEYFQKRGWSGIANQAPKLSDFIQQIRAATDFIYVGHGSGQSTLRSHSLRKMYISPSNVYLFGCSSVAMHRSALDNDRLTDYAIKGSQIIMGCLWKVKDKEINYYCHSFLQAVFEKNLAVSEALQKSRTRCKLPYLTGAACVVYGLPYP